MIRTSLTGLVLASVLAAGSRAQEPGAAHRTAMKKFDILVGKWTGDANGSFGPGAPKTVKQTEDVQFKLGGAVLLIEGTGRGKLPGKDEEGVVFNALGIVSYDERAKKYMFKAYTAERSLEVEMTVTDKGFVWGFEQPEPKIQTRYTMNLTDKGEWHEVGEFSRDGKEWTKFFEMLLTKVKEK